MPCPGRVITSRGNLGSDCGQGNRTAGAPGQDVGGESPVDSIAAKVGSEYHSNGRSASRSIKLCDAWKGERLDAVLTPNASRDCISWSRITRQLGRRRDHRTVAQDTLRDLPSKDLAIRLIMPPRHRSESVHTVIAERRTRPPYNFVNRLGLAIHALSAESARFARAGLDPGAWE